MYLSGNYLLWFFEQEVQVIGKGTEHGIVACQSLIFFDGPVEHGVPGVMANRKSHGLVGSGFLQSEGQHLVPP